MQQKDSMHNNLPNSQPSVNNNQTFPKMNTTDKQLNEKSPYIQLHSSQSFKQVSLSIPRSATILKEYQASPDQFQTTTNLIRVKFKKQLTKEQREKIILNDLKTLVKDNWIIQSCFDNQYSNWVLLFNSVQNIYAFGIRYQLDSYNQNFKLQNELVRPMYDNLTQLVLIDSRINNIQFIASLNSPNLQKLNLNDNYIISFKTLLKLKFKNLSQIKIMQNLIKQIDFSRYNFKNKNNPFLLSFQRQSRFYGHRRDQNRLIKSNVSDRTFLAKLETPYGKYNNSMNCLIAKMSMNALRSSRNALNRNERLNPFLNNRREVINNIENVIIANQVNQQQHFDLPNQNNMMQDSNELDSYQQSPYYEPFNHVNTLIYFSSILAESLKKKYCKSRFGGRRTRRDFF